METQLTFVVEANVKAGALDKLEALAAEMVSFIERTEPRVTGYGLFLNADRTLCSIKEVYADSAAAIAHLDAMKGWFDRLFLLVEPRRTSVFGEPDAALHARLESFGAEIMAPLARFAR